MSIREPRFEMKVIRRLGIFAESMNMSLRRIGSHTLLLRVSPSVIAARAACCQLMSYHSMLEWLSSTRLRSLDTANAHGSSGVMTHSPQSRACNGLVHRRRPITWAAGASVTLAIKVNFLTSRVSDTLRSSWYLVSSIRMLKNHLSGTALRDFA